MTDAVPGAAPRLAVLHTLESVAADVRERLANAGLPEALHVVDPSLLDELLAGVDPAEVHVRLAAHLERLGGADVIATSCSSLTPGVAELRPSLGTTVVAVDEPMAEAAVAHGRLGVLCTSRATVDGTVALLERTAREQGREVALEVCFVEGAYDALRGGDPATHDALVRAAASDLARRVDAIVLAQMSLARLEPELAAATGRVVLSPPGPLIREIARLLAAAPVSSDADHLEQSGEQ